MASIAKHARLEVGEGGLIDATCGRTIKTGQSHTSALATGPLPGQLPSQPALQNTGGT